jgi:16S rRNA (guanine1207-N2)-methyltransferase
VVGVSNHYFSENPTSPEERGLIRTKLRGINFDFATSSGVFSHKRVDSGTRLLVESMRIMEKGRVLDLGCGIGVIGIVVARLNPALEVWMTDVNSRALSLAELNAKSNRVKAIIRQGSLYEPIGGVKFNLIITNPPMSAGIDAVVRPIIEGAPAHLVEKGIFQLVVQSNKGGKTLSEIIVDAFGNIEVTARGGGFRVFTAMKQP